MTTLELVLGMLAEATTTELTRVHDAQGFDQNKDAARRGGEIAGNARRAIEADTEKPVITAENATDFSKLITKVVDETNN